MKETVTWRKNLKRRWQDYQWSVVGVLGIVGLVLGYIGFWRYFHLVGESHSVSDIIYSALQLFPLQSGSVSGPLPWELEVARLLAPGVAVYTGGKALAAIFHEQLQLFRVRFLKNHVVICGLGRKGLLLAKAFRDAGNRVVVVDSDKENSKFDQCIEDGAIVLVGNATDRVMLRKARVHKARHLVSVCGEDSINAEVAVQSLDLVSDRKGQRLECHLHISDYQLNCLLKEKLMNTKDERCFRLHCFNIFENGAQALLAAYPPFPLGENAKSQREIVVIGLGQLGENVIIQAAGRWKNSFGQKGKKLKVTIVDRTALAKTELLHLRHPTLGKVCEVIPLEMDVNSTQFQKADFIWNSSGTFNITNIYVCFDNDFVGLSAGLSLLRQIRDHRIPVIVRMAVAQESGLASLLQASDERPEVFHGLQVFGLLEQTCTLRFLLNGDIECIAQAIHEEYIKKEKEKGITSKENPAMVSWESLSEDIKESNRQQADHIAIKLKTLGYEILHVPLTDWDKPLFEFSQDEIEQLAIIEHKRWIKERKDAGWTFDKEKNLKKKTSPSLRDWNDLTKEDQDRDRNTILAIPWILRRSNFTIVRREV